MRRTESAAPLLSGPLPAGSPLRRVRIPGPPPGICRNVRRNARPAAAPGRASSFLRRPLEVRQIDEAQASHLADLQDFLQKQALY